MFKKVLLIGLVAVVTIGAATCMFGNQVKSWMPAFLLLACAGVGVYLLIKWR